MNGIPGDGLTGLVARGESAIKGFAFATLLAALLPLLTGILRPPVAVVLLLMCFSDGCDERLRVLIGTNVNVQ